MSITDKLKQTQGTKEFSKFKPTRLEVKNVEGKPVFQMWDGEKNVQSGNAMEGIILGQANQAEGFDPTIKPNGGTWVTSYYERNDQIINLYYPGDSKPHKKDTVSNLDASLGSGVDLKRKKILFVLTKKGIFAIKTNMTIAIGQLGQVDLSNFVKITPKVYSSTDQTIPASSHKYLGALASKNPPAYASIEELGPITDEAVADWSVADMSVDEILDEFAKFKERFTSDKEEDRAEKFNEEVDEVVAEMEEEEVEMSNGNLPF